MMSVDTAWLANYSLIGLDDDAHLSQRVGTARDGADGVLGEHAPGTSSRRVMAVKAASTGPLPTAYLVRSTEAVGAPSPRPALASGAGGDRQRDESG